MNFKMINLEWRQHFKTWQFIQEDDKSHKRFKF